jgi:hypothetical protein
LESLSLGKRVVILVVVVALALLLLFAFNRLLDGGAGAQQQPEPVLYSGIPLDATLLRLDKRALEEAYHLALVRLFGVWLSQGAPQDAHQIINGLRIARRAYNQAAQQIAKREQQLLESDRQQQQQEQPKEK